MPFWGVPLDSETQLLLAFEWQDPKTKTISQYYWTVLPQGLKNLPILFGEVLAKDLRTLQLDQGILLQYMDDSMITSPDFEHCLSKPILMLNHLANCGYKVSLQKTQIYKQQVSCLGFQLSQMIHSLMVDQKQAIVNIKTPTNWRQFCRFSGWQVFVIHGCLILP